MKKIIASLSLLLHLMFHVIQQQSGSSYYSYKTAFYQIGIGYHSFVWEMFDNLKTSKVE